MRDGDIQISLSLSRSVLLYLSIYLSIYLFIYLFIYYKELDNTIMEAEKPQDL